MRQSFFAPKDFAFYIQQIYSQKITGRNNSRHWIYRKKSIKRSEKIHEEPGCEIRSQVLYCGKSGILSLTFSRKGKTKMSKEEKLAKTIAFAAEKHAHQKRKDGTPYIFHPLAVAELLKRYGYDIDYQVAGVLHDVLEDTDATDEEVRAFGENVYEAVKLVTRPKGADESEYVKNILGNRMAAAVKNADKIHNMYDIITTNNRNAILNYAKKVKKYYKGKFSYALDNAIDNALYMSDFCNIKKEMRCCIPDYTMEEMTLYSDKRKEAKKRCLTAESK